MTRFDREEANAYWRLVHARGGEIDPQRDPDLLEVVCHPGMPRWYNRYIAHTQRVAFRDALRRCKPIEGLRVLEIGCGSGRWSRWLHAAGARVLAIDISEDVIRRNRAAMPEIDFLSGDFVDLEVAEEGFDGMTSVTVIQHLPPETQELAVAKMARLLRPGGFVLLLENVREDGVHVFANDIGDWGRLMARHGMRRVWARGYEYDLPIRAVGQIVGLLRRGKDAGRPDPSPEDLVATMFRGRHRHLKTLAYGPAVLASYPAEWISRSILPGSVATHAAMVFRKQ